MVQVEDALLGLFGVGGLITILANALLNSNNSQYEAVGGLLIAIGVVLKAFVPESTPSPSLAPPPASK